MPTPEVVDVLKDLAFPLPCNLEALAVPGSGEACLDAASFTATCRVCGSAALLCAAHHAVVVALPVAWCGECLTRGTPGRVFTFATINGSQVAS